MNMTDGLRRRAALFVTGVLTGDGVLHLYWATGARWPATDERSLSLAVLGGDVPFGPTTVLPLAALLFVAAGCVYLRQRVGRRSRLGLIRHVGTLAVAAGVAARALAGVVWAFGVGIDQDSAFYWLNLIVYTPLCIVLAVSAYLVARDH